MGQYGSNFREPPSSDSCMVIAPHDGGVDRLINLQRLVVMYQYYSASADGDCRSSIRPSMVLEPSSMPDGRAERDDNRFDVWVESS